MFRMIALALVWLALAVPASAHKLKLFATVEGQTVSGYGFFAGGGRPKDVSWEAQDAAGLKIASGKTDAKGAFKFDVPADFASDLKITLDTGEAHLTSTTLAASRFTPVVRKPELKEPAAAAAGVETDASAELVEAAVQRQVAPLMERIERMDDRMRYTDILSGAFLLIGITGIVLWARSTRRR